MLTLIHFGLPGWQTKVASDSVCWIISGVSYHVPYTDVADAVDRLLINHEMNMSLFTICQYTLNKGD